MVDSDEGDFRLRFSDAAGSSLDKVLEIPSEVADNSLLRSEQYRVDMSEVVFKQDDKIEIYYRAAITATTADYGLSTLKIPITRKNLRSGKKTPTYLRDGDFRSADVTLPVAWTLLGTYTVGAQEELKIGHENPYNSTIYMALVENA